MLDGVEHIFDRMPAMLKKLKKNSYKENMEAFLEEHGHYFEEMVRAAEESEDPNRTAAQTADAFVSAVEETFLPAGKRRERLRTDLTFFMIYYVFPAILKTGSPAARTTADALCTAWSSRISSNPIRYTTYEKLYDSFREKIFGIF